MSHFVYILWLKASVKIRLCPLRLPASVPPCPPSQCEQSNSVGAHPKEAKKIGLSWCACGELAFRSKLGDLSMAFDVVWRFRTTVKVRCIW